MQQLLQAVGPGTGSDVGHTEGLKDDRRPACPKEARAVTMTTRAGQGQAGLTGKARRKESRAESVRLGSHAGSARPHLFVSPVRGALWG